MAQKINQKEYLKKYLGGGGDKKKKKSKKEKSKTIKGQTVNIVDDDIDLKHNSHLDDEELEAALQMNEDAPQIVGVIDDRPPELRALDYKNSMWRSLADVTGNQEQTKKMLKEELFAKKTKESIKPEKKKKKRRSRSRSSRRSPPRQQANTPDISPPRRRQISPDASPPRRKRASSDESPPRRRQKSPDMSPPRRRRTPDLSPVRRRERTPDLSPKRRKRSPKDDRKSRWADSSPPRRIDPQPSRYKPTPSPPRRKVDTKPTRYKPTPSPPRRHKREPRPRTPSPPPTHKKMADGKKAGLQQAKQLRTENDEHRRKEDEMYEKMSVETSGRGAEARARATGAMDRRKMKEDLAKEQEKEERYKKRKEVYDVWGKGLKQVEAYQERLQDAANEAAKPLARYADDTELEDHLRLQERLGDPMLDYMRSKKKEKRIKDRVAEKPTYQGLYPDNRFNIRPGYRWDGVDRSNGFEKRLFESRNLREAAKDEAYLYSTEDM